MDIFSNDCIDQFLSHLKLAQGCSPLTLESYKRDLNTYLDYKNRSRSLLFQEYLETKGLCLRSQSRTLSAVRSYFRYLEKHGQKVHFKESLKIPVIKKSLPHFVSHDEFKKIFQASEVPNQKEKTIRNHVVLYFLYGLACRVSEVISLNLSDYMDSDESIIITGKGNKQRVLPLTEPFLSLLREYIREYRSSKNHGALILNNRGHRLSRVDVWRWIKKWSAQAGIEPKSPHQFRHGCATELLNHGADLRSIQALLGHSSIETTKIYTEVSRVKIKKLLIFITLFQVKSVASICHSTLNLLDRD